MASINEEIGYAVGCAGLERRCRVISVLRSEKCVDVRLLSKHLALSSRVPNLSRD